MQDDLRDLPRDCAETRALFSQAFVEPAAEEEIMLHAVGCFDCMDAFLELKDTVRQLETAATEIPVVDDFTSRVFEGIDRAEVRRRKQVRTGAMAAVFFFAGIALTLAVTLPLSGRGGRGDGAPDGDRKSDPAPGPVEPREVAVGPKPGETPEVQSPADEPLIPLDIELQPGDEPPPASDSVEQILEAVLAAQKEIALGHGNQRGRRGMKMRSLMHRISLLSMAERAELLKLLEAEPSSNRPGLEKPFRDQLMERIKTMPSLPPRRPFPPGRGGGKGR